MSMQSDYEQIRASVDRYYDFINMVDLEKLCVRDLRRKHSFAMDVVQTSGIERNTGGIAYMCVWFRPLVPLKRVYELRSIIKREKIYKNASNFSRQKCSCISYSDTNQRRVSIQRETASEAINASVIRTTVSGSNV